MSNRGKQLILLLVPTVAYLHLRLRNNHIQIPSSPCRAIRDAL
jgi:hypothetical protein